MNELVFYGIVIIVFGLVLSALGVNLFYRGKQMINQDKKLEIKLQNQAVELYLLNSRSHMKQIVSRDFSEQATKKYNKDGLLIEWLVPDKVKEDMNMTQGQSHFHNNKHSRQFFDKDGIVVWWYMIGEK